MAFVTRALREQNRQLASQEQWQATIRVAAEGSVSLGMLTQQVASWGWQTEVEQLLWLAADRFPWQNSALETLNRGYYTSGNTDGLFRTFERMQKLDPSDPVTSNNLAMVMALLGREQEKAFLLAAEAHKKHPSVPAFISTYAYLLHLRGRTDEGLKLLAALPPEELKAPTRALYYGIMLQAKGEMTASSFLDIAERGRLLPEEQSLLKSARTAPVVLQK
jgi:tetratricopeptide (TPR) repeat protein